MTPKDGIRSAVHPPAHRGPDAHEHVVEFYETDRFLADTVSDFVGPGLHAGGAAIVVATAEHRVMFEAALHAAGIDDEQLHRMGWG